MQIIVLKLNELFYLFISFIYLVFIQDLIVKTCVY